MLIRAVIRSISGSFIPILAIIGMERIGLMGEGGGYENQTPPPHTHPEERFEW